MAIERLLETLARDADREAEALRDAARVEAARLRAESAARTAARLDDDVAAFRIARQAEADAAIAAASQRWRREVLRARAAMLEQLRTATAALLPSVVDDELAALLERAARDAAGPDAVVERVATGARARAGAVTVDATLESLLERAWARLQIEALR